MEKSFVPIPVHFRRQADVQPDQPAYATKEGGAWVTRTWAQYVAEVTAFGKALIAGGIRKGEIVAILSGNRPEWVVADMGAMSVGAVSTGIYFTCSAAQVGAIVSDSRAAVVVVENERLLERVLDPANELPLVRHIVVVDSEFRESSSTDPRVCGWAKFVEKGEAVDDASFREALDGITEGDLSSLVYTSGTTNRAKGVMILHGSLVEITRMGLQMIEHPTLDYRLLSYLPLAHVAERGLSILGPAMQGYTVYFAESIDKLSENLKEVRPTFFLGVPRLWEKIHDVLQARFDQLTGARSRLVAWARRQGLEETTLSIRDGQPSALQSIRHKLARRVVLDPIARQLGLNKVTTAISGSAPMAVHVLQFFASLGITIQEVYGLTETGGPASFNRSRDAKFGSIGKPFGGVTMKLSEDGEILVKGENIFAGYFGDPVETNNALIDGWLHTGDIGECDADGFYSISGRKKELIITSYGKNIAPRKIEEALKANLLIDEAVVVGEGRSFIGALIVVNEKQRAIVEAAGASSDTVERTIQDHVDEVNRSLSRAEAVKRFRVLPQPLSIENGEYTPTMKLVRHAIARNYSAEIDVLYRGLDSASVE